MGADMKALGGGAAHFSEVTVLPLSPSHSLVMPSLRSVGAVAFEVEAAELVAGQAAKGKEVVSIWEG